jgi:hypothetical protein
MPERNFVVAESGEDGDHDVVTLSALLIAATPSELDSFKGEGLQIVKSNDTVVAMSAYMITEEGPVATFHLQHPYSLAERTTLETWLRQHPLVRRIIYEEDVSH